MTISMRSSFKKRHCIGVARLSDVNGGHRDALRRGVDDWTGHVFCQRVGLPVRMAWCRVECSVRTMRMQCGVRVALIECTIFVRA